MKYIFLDESGDLGFDFSKQATSRYFIVTVLFTDYKRPIQKLIRKVHANLRKKYKIRTSTLHAAKEESVNILRICRGLTDKNCQVLTICVDKNKVFPELRSKKHALYNYIVSILLDRVVGRHLVSAKDSLLLVASKRETNKFFNQNFHEYLRRQIKNSYGIELEIEIKTPAEEKCLQAADIASWSIFRKHEYGDDRYYRVLESIIVEERILFK